MRTPWGIADHVAKLGDDGLLSVSTPSHGGFYVPDKLLHRMSKEAQDYAMKWSRSYNWYEEDCAWAFVALAFPEHFNAEQIQAAVSTMKFVRRK